MKSLKFRNGDEMPALGLGTWKSKPGEVYKAVREAIKVGYRHIDCAHIYMNEAEIGEALKDAFANGDVKREELWVTSKLWNSSHLHDDVQPALELTLKNLQLNYLDLYLMHWPVALKPGVVYPQSTDDFMSLDDAPIDNTWQAMEKCADQDLAIHIGVSNFSIKKIKSLIATCEIPPEANQIELQPLLQQNDMLQFCKKKNIALTAYSPLGSLDRPTQFKAPDEPRIMENPVIIEIASKHGYSPAQVLIRWAIQRGTAVLPKSVNPERIKQNFHAATIELTEGDMEKIKALDIHKRIIAGGFWNAPEYGYTMETLWDE